MKRLIRITESDLHRMVKESVYKILKEDDNMNGTDEEFDAFMKWAMTDGNDYGFGDAAGEYVSDGDPSKLYMIAMTYGKMVGMNPEIVFNIAKEAAEGIYGFMGNIGDNTIDLTNMGDSN